MHQAEACPAGTTCLHEVRNEQPVDDEAGGVLAAHGDLLGLLDERERRFDDVLAGLGSAHNLDELHQLDRVEVVQPDGMGRAATGLHFIDIESHAEEETRSPKRKKRTAQP